MEIGYWINNTKNVTILFCKKKNRKMGGNKTYEYNTIDLLTRAPSIVYI